MDAYKNFAYSTVATAPSPASSGTSLVVFAGDGGKFPAVPFNAVVWPAGAQPLTSNAEIVRVTNRATDTLTITRAQESTSARTVVVGDQIMAAWTAKLVTDLPGTELAYTEFTSSVSITATTEGTANTIVTAPAVTFDGVTPCMIEFYCYAALAGTTDITVILFEDGSAIGQIGYHSNGGKYVAMRASRRRTPASGSRTYSIRGKVDAGTGNAGANPGGAGLGVPGYIRITRV